MIEIVRIIYEVKGNTLVLSSTKEFFIDAFNADADYDDRGRWIEGEFYTAEDIIGFFKTVLVDGQIAIRVVYTKTR